MNEKPENRNQKRSLPHAVAFWAVPAVALFVVVFLLAQVVSQLGGRGFGLGAYTSIQFVLNTNAAALASTLGILMAIVLLMVQLTAQRYSFNIIGMFVANPRNVAIVVLFIITISFNLWLAASVDEDHIPQAGVYLALGLGTLCLGLLIPYFKYLFDTLTPHHLLDGLKRETVAALDSAAAGRRVDLARELAYDKILQIGDIARTAVALSDADVAAHSVWTLHDTLALYLEYKPRLPDEWFAFEDRFFRERHALVIKEIRESGTWFERHLLEELRVAFSNSLNRLEAVNTTVALCCRLASERALEHRDEAALGLLLRFINTFLRAALNAHDARAGYHLLYQYALLASTALCVRTDVALGIARRLGYYGEAAVANGLLWMAVAAAQDLRSLVEASLRDGRGRDATEQIQQELLELVLLAEARQSPATTMLRKAVIALGGFHLYQGDEELARHLARALMRLDRQTLIGLAEELQAVTEPQFWELTERVVNFDYVEEGARARLADFLALVTADDGRAQKRPRSVELAT
jgi:hypothetical protein